MINNFKIIENFMQFEEGTFYKFELLIRNTDGPNPLYTEGSSQTNKNILIKSWYVDNIDYYNKIKHEMVTLSNLTGARLYVTLDRKDNLKLVSNIIHAFTNTLICICNGQKPSIKNIAKTFASETSKVENSSKHTRTIMFDVDTTNEIIVDSVLNYIESKGQKHYTLKTKKGYHIICFRKFDHSDWEDSCIEFLSNDWTIEDYSEQIKAYQDLFVETVSVKENELGLVYHPTAEVQE